MVWPTLISVAEVPGPYFAWASADAAPSARPANARNTTPVPETRDIWILPDRSLQRRTFEARAPDDDQAMPVAPKAHAPEQPKFRRGVQLCRGGGESGDSR